MDINQIKPAVTDYIARVAKQITIKNTLLYGSIAENRATETSDVDLLVISKDFNGLDEDERLKILYRASVGFPYDLHVYGVTPEEFATASPLTTLGMIKSSTTIPLTP